MTSISWRGQEIHNPAIRVLAVFVFLPLGILIALLGAMIWFPLITLSVPFHFLLVMCGRRGFASRGTEGGIVYHVGIDGFRRA